MHVRRAVLRFLVIVPVILAATVYVFTREPVRGIDLQSRLVSSEPLLESFAESCTWDVAAPDRVAQQGRQGGGTAGPGPAMGDPNVAARMPVRTIRDPYAGLCRDPRRSRPQRSRRDGRVQVQHLRVRPPRRDAGVGAADHAQALHRRRQDAEPLQQRRLRRHENRRHLHRQQRFRARRVQVPAHGRRQRRAGQRAGHAVRRVRHDGRRRTRRNVLHHPARWRRSRSTRRARPAKTMPSD